MLSLPLSLPAVETRPIDAELEEDEVLVPDSDEPAAAASGSEISEAEAASDRLSDDDIFDSDADMDDPNLIAEKKQRRSSQGGKRRSTSGPGGSAQKAASSGGGGATSRPIPPPPLAAVAAAAAAGGGLAGLQELQQQGLVAGGGYHEALLLPGQGFVMPGAAAVPGMIPGMVPLGGVGLQGHHEHQLISNAAASAQPLGKKKEPVRESRLGGIKRRASEDGNGTGPGKLLRTDAAGAGGSGERMSADAAKKAALEQLIAARMGGSGPGSAPRGLARMGSMDSWGGRQRGPPHRALSDSAVRSRAADALESGLEIARKEQPDAAAQGVGGGEGGEAAEGEEKLTPKQVAAQIEDELYKLYGKRKVGHWYCGDGLWPSFCSWTNLLCLNGNVTLVAHIPGFLKICAMLICYEQPEDAACRYDASLSLASLHLIVETSHLFRTTFLSPIASLGERGVVLHRCRLGKLLGASWLGVMMSTQADGLWFISMLMQVA